MKLYAIIAAACVLVALAVASVARAGDGLSGPNGEHKVVVCKYVGTPGIDERLQTGQNPIVVDYHSLTGDGFDGTFSFTFSDAQGKSVAVQWTFDEHFSDLSVCPAPVGPPPCETDCPPPPCTTDCPPPPCEQDCPPPPCNPEVDVCNPPPCLNQHGDCPPPCPIGTPVEVISGKCGPPVHVHHHHGPKVPPSPTIKQYLTDVTHGADTGGG